MLKSAFSLIFGLLIAFTAQETSAVLYNYITLDVPGSASTNATGVDANSEVVGSYVDASGITHGFIYSGGNIIHREGNYSTLDPAGATYTSAQGISAYAQVVGIFRDALGTTRSFIYSRGEYTTLAVPGATYTYANGISTDGQVVGTWLDSLGKTHGFVFSEGNYTILDVPGANYTSALGISSSDQLGNSSSSQVVGNYSYDPTSSNGNGEFGFIYSGGQYKTLTPPSAKSTHPIGINDSGQVIGNYWDASNILINFVFNEGNYIALNMPGSTYTSVQAINANSQVLGWYSDACGTMRGFVYSSGNYTTLAVPGATQTSPGGISENGHVVGYYIDSNQKRHGFLAVPSYLSLTGGLFAPTPSIYQNCNQIAISLDPGPYQGVNGDWWFVAYSPTSGHWYSYSYPLQWRDIGTNLNNITAAYQGPLVNATNLTLFDIRMITSGTYYLYFGVDTNMNGVLDMDRLYYTEYTLIVP